MLHYLFIFAILSVSHSAPANEVSYENYKLLKVIPTTSDHLALLKNLGDDKAYDLWIGPKLPSVPVDIMVSPKVSVEFFKYLNTTGIQYKEMIANVQDVIDKQRVNFYEGDFGWIRYHSLNEIYNWMDSLGERFPDKVQVINMGSSYEERPIKGVKLSFGPSRPGIFIEGGIHAREWISPATVTYIINELLSSDDPEIRELAETHDWYIVPSINPDGYVYTHETNRLWRKTRSKNCKSCKGTDLNRNWAFQWNSGGASLNPCSNLYAGLSPFSEIEAKSISDYLLSISDNLFAYLAFHSYSQLLMFPYGHTTEHLDNHEEEMAIAIEATNALARRYGTKYMTGNIAETIYIASGSSVDWVKANLKLPITYTYELRDTGRYGFLLPPSEIIPNGQEVMDSLVAMFKEAGKFGYPKP